MFTSLQRKLLAMILSAAIICIGMMGGAWYQSHFSMLETAAKERLQAEATLIELDPLVLVKDKEAAFYVMLLTMLVSMVFAIGIFIVYRNQVSQPLSRVADRMKELLESDPLSQWMDAGFGANHPGFKRLPVESDDEVGKLISAFNSLLHNLETNFEQVYARYRDQESNLNQFREMTEATPIPIVISRIEDGQMLFHNPASLALVDDLRPNPEDKNISEYYLDPAARRRLRRLLQARGEVSNYEFKARKMTGRKLWLSVSVRTIQYHGEAAYLAVMADLTERKKHEDQLRQFNEKLEETIKERTQDLNAARQAAESSSQAKGEFLANMSHEIRTPMNAVIGFAHLVLDTNLNAMQRDYVGKMLGASEDLLGVINDILDFSKVEAGKLEMESIAFDLSKTLEKVASIAGIKAEEKGLSFLLDYPPEMPMHLIGDPLRLKQVLINLVNNAVKFTERGEIRLAIEVLQQQEDSIALKVAVSDTGIGMGAHEQARLFKAFAQADSSITRKYGGSGLGLAISKHLVELMGGNIQVDSVLHQGSTFYFTVTFGIDASSRLKKIKLPESLQGRRALIVDDNPTVNIVLERYVSALGMQTYYADSAEQGLHDLARHGWHPV